MLSRLLRRAPPAVVPITLSADEVWALRRKNRAERRRLERAQREAELNIRVCINCGYGAVKGVPHSNLVSSPNGPIHASPTVCAGYVAAITSQARETVHEASSDLARITWMRIQQYTREFLHSLKTFARDESSS